MNALKDVSFEVKAGEIVGLVGANGAGKTTLFRIIAGLLEPTGGSVTIDGQDISKRRKEAIQQLGLVLEGARGVYKRLTGLENLVFFGVMQGLTRDEAASRAVELLERLGLADRDRRAFGYSAGMRVRLALARSLIADPSLLLLDEPTRSLDPAASLDAMRLVLELASQGRAVLLATHRLDEVREFCDRVVVLEQGRLTHVGTPATTDFKAVFGAET